MSAKSGYAQEEEMSSPVVACGARFSQKPDFCVKLIYGVGGGLCDLSTVHWKSSPCNEPTYPRTQCECRFMNREYHRWYSPSLERDMELLVFGHSGARTLVFPTSMGRFFQWED